MEGVAYTAATSVRDGLPPNRERRTSAVSNDRQVTRLTRHLETRPFGLRQAVRNLLLYGSNTVRDAFNELIRFDGAEVKERPPRTLENKKPM